MTINVQNENKVIKNVSKKKTKSSKNSSIKKTLKRIVLDKDCDERISNAHCKQDLLMRSLSTYFSSGNNIDDILEIINGKSKISLRLIDWFVTNYCKKNNTAYELRKNKFIVHLNYKTQLKSFSKKQFDPFRRDSRIMFEYGKNKKIVTTVGQLNFFRWAIRNNIIKYIENNLDDIEKDMNNSTKRAKKIKSTTGTSLKKNTARRKRRELSKSATKTVNKHNSKIVVSFN